MIVYLSQPLRAVQFYKFEVALLNGTRATNWAHTAATATRYAAWPEKNRQMYIKVAQKQFH